MATIKSNLIHNIEFVQNKNRKQAKMNRLILPFFCLLLFDTLTPLIEAIRGKFYNKIAVIFFY